MVDWNDPCARAEELRAAYYRLLAGAQEAQTSYSGNGVTRETRYVQSDLQQLMSEIRTAEAECAAKNGDIPARRPRFAIQAGSRRIAGPTIIKGPT